MCGPNPALHMIIRMGVPVVHSCSLCLQTKVASLFLHLLNTEVHKGVNKTRKKPLELEKDYL